MTVTPVATSMPATPLSDTPIQDPLVSYASYLAVTDDTITPSATVVAAVATATTLCEQYCNRTFVFGHYTEDLYFYNNGFVYPSAYPIAQVDSAGDASPPVIQGAGVWVGWFLVSMLPIWRGFMPPQTNLSYWGGYTSDTVPPRLARAIAKTAWFICNPGQLPGMPGGVKASNINGVSISGSLSSYVLSDPQLGKDLDRFRRELAHPWGS